MITFEKLTNDLQSSLKLHPDDTLLVHSSMKSIGDVAGGADTVLQVLMDYFGKNGLLVFPTLSYRTVTAENPYFDVLNTPACTGILPELFRKKAGVIRSLHPTHSVAAYGRDAAEFVSGHEKASTPAPVGSPWWKLLQRSGKILFIGTGVGCNTFLHGMDEWLQLEGFISDVPVTMNITDHNGITVPTQQFRHCAGRNSYYASLEDALARCGALSYGSFGKAACHIVDCRKTASMFNYFIGD